MVSLMQCVTAVEDRRAWRLRKGQWLTTHRQRLLIDMSSVLLQIKVFVVIVVILIISVALQHDGQPNFIIQYVNCLLYLWQVTKQNALISKNQMTQSGSLTGGEKRESDVFKSQCSDRSYMYQTWTVAM